MVTAVVVVVPTNFASLIVCPPWTLQQAAIHAIETGRNKHFIQPGTWKQSGQSLSVGGSPLEDWVELGLLLLCPLLGRPWSVISIFSSLIFFFDLSLVSDLNMLGSVVELAGG